MSPDDIGTTASIINDLNQRSLVGVIWPAMLLIGYHLYKKYQTKKVMNGYVSKSGVTLDSLHEAVKGLHGNVEQWGKGVIDDRNDSKSFRKEMRESFKDATERLGEVEGDNKAQEEAIKNLKMKVFGTPPGTANTGHPNA